MLCSDLQEVQRLFVLCMMNRDLARPPQLIHYVNGFLNYNCSGSGSNGNDSFSVEFRERWIPNLCLLANNWSVKKTPATIIPLVD